MKKLRHLAEYLFARLVLCMVDMLPVAFSEALVAGLCDLLYFLSFRRRAVTIDNIMMSGLCSDRRAASRLGRKSFRHFGLVILESLRSNSILEGTDWRQHVDIRVSPELERILFDPAKGLIMASGHFGSWEIAAQITSLAKPVAGVTHVMTNPYVERLMQKRKPRERFFLIPKYDRDNTGRFLKVLKDGHLLALMIDQHASWGGMIVNFFGRPASTYRTVAILHLVTGAPLCFGYCRRTSPHHYELVATGPYHYKPSGDRDADIRRILEDLNQELEKAIRLAPEQYLWGHRRWKVKETAPISIISGVDKSSQSAQDSTSLKNDVAHVEALL
ncbi:MAG: lysophospholipid acyltransferase family protein [bacterium]